MSVLMIFIDGIGIGENDKDKNPFARFPSPVFPIFKEHHNDSVPFGGIVVPTNPTMNVSGLPQSATGQTALLTGVNSAQAMGRHAAGFPGPTLREIIKDESIFLKLEKMHKSATFANAFTPEYFERPARQISATTWSVRASQFPFRMVAKELVQGQAISHDLTNEFLSNLGCRVPIRTPKESADILVDITESVDFCLFEFILTDIVGHRQDMRRAESLLQRLADFIATVLSRIDLGRHLVLVTSDHGNFEDLSISTHTRNWVPTIVWGRHRKKFAAAVHCLEDVVEAVMIVLNDNGE